MGAQHLLNPFSESIHAEQAGQGIMVEHQTYLIILLPAEGLDPLRCNDCQRGKQEQQQQQSLPVLMKKIEHVIPVQTPGGIIQNHRLPAGIRQQGDALFSRSITA